jgi:hypothetical protein
MSDNRRVYRTIRRAIKQMYPHEPKGNEVRMLTTLAAMVSGIVLGKSCQLPTIASKAPDRAMADSRIKRYSRWIQNERIDYEGYYLPFVNELLVSLANIRELVFIIDGSEVGHQCITLMISLIYGKRALPITWLVVKGSKGHLPERLFRHLNNQVFKFLTELWHSSSRFVGKLPFTPYQFSLPTQDCLGLKYPNEFPKLPCRTVVSSINLAAMTARVSFSKVDERNQNGEKLC